MFPASSSTIFVACMAIIFLFVFRVILRVIVNHIKWWQMYKKMGPDVYLLGPLHPIWGSLHLFKDADQFYALTRSAVVRTRCKMTCGWPMNLFPVFQVCHPEYLHALIKIKTRKPDGMASVYSLFRRWLGEGLLIANGRRWERNRKLLTPAFHFEILKPYVKIYNEVLDTFLDKMSRASEGGASVEICEPISLATLDTMMRCTLSYDDDVQTLGKTHPYVAAVVKLTSLLTQRTMQPWVWPDFSYSLTSEGKEHDRLCHFVHTFAESIIQKRKKALEEDPSQLQKRKLDFLDIILTAKDENGKGMTDKEIRAEVDTFLFEGHDTTASALGWTVYCLAKYSDMQDEIYEEINEVIPNKNYTTWDDIHQMKKLSMFIKEAIRMYSPVPFISRFLEEDLVLPHVTIPAGLNCDININSLHHHPDIYPDHDVFNPKRFENDKERDPFSFVPFSVGARNCIGQVFALNEMKVFLSRILNRFKLSLDKDHVVEPHRDAITRTSNGIKVYFEKRG